MKSRMNSMGRYYAWPSTRRLPQKMIDLPIDRIRGANAPSFETFHTYAENQQTPGREPG